MLVFLVQGKEIEVQTRREIKSSYINNLQKETLKTEGKKCVISVEAKYATVINDYISFLEEGKHEIGVHQNLVKYFNLSIFFEDDDYFLYLMSEVYRNWFKVSKIIYYDMKEKMKKKIYLHLPYDLVPKDVMNGPTFFKQWIANPHNKNVNLDDVDTYTTQVKYQNNTLTLFEVTHKRCNVVIVTEYDANQQPRYQSMRKDGNKEGVWRTWFNNGRIATEECFVDGKGEGTWKYWAESSENVLGKKLEYKNDEEIETTTYHENGKEKTYLKRRDKYYTYRSWDENGKYRYDDPKRDHYERINNMTIQFSAEMARLGFYR